MLNSKFTNNSVLENGIILAIFCFFFVVSACQKEELIESKNSYSEYQTEFLKLYKEQSDQISFKDNSKSGKDLRTLFLNKEYKVKWNKGNEYKNGLH